MHTRDSHKKYHTLSFQSSGQEFRAIEFPKRARGILESCYITFDDHKLVLKIGGNNERRGNLQRVQKTTEILKFSGYDANFKKYQGFKVTKHKAFYKLLQMWII